MADPGAVSLMSLAQFRSYTAAAERLVQFAARADVPLFAGALAGVMLIREYVETAGGGYDFWAKLLVAGHAGLKDIIFDPGGAVPTKGGKA